MTKINRKPEEPRPESILECIPRLWAEGKLYWFDDKDRQIKPFPKPEIEEG
ncbi:MAG: hypothetical protein IMF11_17380 [Proteobacteria bacterium]|nr:hypothetical protein [Pseudomonadota bacterium]